MNCIKKLSLLHQLFWERFILMTNTKIPWIDPKCQIWVMFYVENTNISWNTGKARKITFLNEIKIIRIALILNLKYYSIMKNWIRRETTTFSRKCKCLEHTHKVMITAEMINSLSTYSIFHLCSHILDVHW